MRSKSLVGHGELGVAAVDVIAGEQRRVAKVLAPEVQKRHTPQVQPSHGTPTRSPIATVAPGPVSIRPTISCPGIMRLAPVELTVDDVQIGAADPARRHADEHLTRLRFRRRHLGEHQWPPRTLEHHGLHGPMLRKPENGTGRIAGSSQRSDAPAPLYGEAAVNDFDEFFADHYAWVVGSLALACGDRGEAEDAAQEGFTKAMLRWRSVSRYDRPATWVYVVAVRELRRSLRRRERSSAADLADDAPVLDPAVAVVTTDVITRALDRLAPRQRLAVVLRFHGDLTVPDVAKAMQCSEGTVKATLHAALSRLRVDLGDRSLEGAPDGA